MTRQKQPRRIVTAWTTINRKTIRLGGVTEIATDLGVDASRITTWTNRKRLNDRAMRTPDPVLVLAMGPVYDIDAWRAYRDMPARTREETEALALQYANEDRERDAVAWGMAAVDAG